MSNMNKPSGGMDMSAMMPMMMMMMSMMGGMGGGVGGGMNAPNPTAPNTMGMNPMMAAMGGMPGMTGPPICQFYAKSGWCKYGDDCMLKHIGPSKPPPNLQNLGEFMGVIKSYNPDKGFGFIACDALKEEHKDDVFLSQKHIGEFQAGAEDKFEAVL